MSRGVRRSELQPCRICGKGLMHDGTPAVYRVTVEQLLIDSRAAQRAIGLEMVLGSAGLAVGMGPDEEIAVPVTDGPPAPIVVCQPCAMERQIVLAWEMSLSDPKGGDS